MAPGSRQAPERTTDAGSGEGPILTNDRALKKWLAELPMANPEAAGRELLLMARQIGQSSSAPKARVKAARSLEESAASVLTGLEKRVVGMGVPLDAQSERLHRMAVDLRLELGRIYLHAAQRAVQGGAKPGMLTRRAVTEWLGFAVHHFGGALLQCWLAYRPVVAGIWRSLHLIYALARRIGADTARFRAPGAQRVVTSIRAEYLRFNMVALADPAHRTQRDILGIAAAGRDWSQDVRLRKAVNQSGWIILPDQDEAARWVEKPVAGWWLSMDKLQDELEKVTSAIEVTDEFGTPTQLSPEVIDGLVRFWRGRLTREHQRVEAGYHLMAVVGLHDVHFKVGVEAEFSAYLDGLPARSALTKDRLRDAHPTIGEVVAFDQSFGGYRIRWVTQAPVRVRVGELIALAQPTDDDDDPTWMLGLISWVTAIENGEIEAGVRLVSRRPVAAAVRTGPQRFERAFVLPGSRKEGKQVLLEADHGERDEQIVIVSRTLTGFRQDHNRLSADAQPVNGYVVHDLLPVE